MDGVCPTWREVTTKSVEMRYRSERNKTNNRDGRRLANGWGESEACCVTAETKTRGRSQEGGRPKEAVRGPSIQPLILSLLPIHLLTLDLNNSDAVSRLLFLAI